jgi:methyl-accepting chemotaxis protein
MGLITRANREHSAAGETILKSLVEIGVISDRNVQGVQESRRATDTLRERAAGLAAIADRLGRAAGPARRRQGGRGSR